MTGVESSLEGFEFLLELAFDQAAAQAKDPCGTGIQGPFTKSRMVSDKCYCKWQAYSEASLRMEYLAWSFLCSSASNSV